MGATLLVTEDEPCFLLVEMNLQSPGSKGWRRYQILTVVRDDKLAQARIDLGPASSHRAHQFRILGGVHDEATGKIEILHTVGELRDMADVQRTGQIPQIEPARDWNDRYHDQRDQRRRQRRGLSSIGAHARVQRSN